jgi:hypothetical protein
LDLRARKIWPQNSVSAPQSDADLFFQAKGQSSIEFAFWEAKSTGKSTAGSVVGLDGVRKNSNAVGRGSD